MCVYIYIYIYIWKEKEPETQRFKILFSAISTIPRQAYDSSNSIQFNLSPSWYKVSLRLLIGQLRGASILSRPIRKDSCYSSHSHASFCLY